MDQSSRQDSTPISPAMRAAAFSVHVFTALGAGIALIALVAAGRRHWAAMLAWLGVAVGSGALRSPIVRRPGFRDWRWPSWPLHLSRPSTVGIGLGWCGCARCP